MGSKRTEESGLANKPAAEYYRQERGEAAMTSDYPSVFERSIF